jgi:hypothetical protein
MVSVLALVIFVVVLDGECAGTTSCGLALSLVIFVVVLHGVWW